MAPLSPLSFCSRHSFLMEQTFSYAPLQATATDAASADGHKPFRGLFFALSLLALSSFLIYHASDTHVSQIEPELDRVWPGWASRGPADGVSEKAGSGFLSGHRVAYPWTNDMLQWQRTGFHFQPPRNWMNDPNGPVFYKGWYHLFYQYNCDGVVWGNITWGHAVSRDLLHWLHLPIAMLPDRWYDTNGVWTGSATVLPDGNLVMIYTGSTNSTAQVQCLAVPADPEGDPLLIRWRKHESNPVLLPPPSVLPRDFRDPTTAWADPSDLSAFLLAIGSKDDSAGLHTGVTYVYSTRDFLSYQLLPGVLHAVEGTGMWECVDFFPVSTDDASAGFGLDTSERAGERVKHVLKASMDDDRCDYYALGSYDAEANKWVPDDAENDVGIGLRYDWGKFYASKTFYDEGRRRRVLWGWVGEADSEGADASKGWASVMSIPRTVVFDSKTASNLLFWPVDEVGSLRTALHEFASVVAGPGAVVPLRIPLTAKAAQLDVEAEFEVLRPVEVEGDVGYNCSTSGGAAGRGVLGPFGLLVLATDNLTEQTATYFYLSRSAGGGLRTHFCQDETRSSAASDIEKRVVGSTVPVLDGELLTVRILIDHSIVESFAQGGRSAITSRVYPTKSFKSAKVFLFNNATSTSIKAKTIKIWEMDSTFNHIYEEEAQKYT